MNQLEIDAQIIGGELTLKNLPIDNAEVKVVITPKLKLDDLSFREVQKLLSGIKRDLADDIIKEREES
jgi:hypothetical protein